MQKRSGFTALELIVVLGVFVIAVSTILPFIGTFQQAQTLQASTDELLQTLRRAQNASMTGQYGSAWGVHREEASFTKFSGPSYELRNPRLDEVHTIAEQYSLLGPREILFEPLTGTVSKEVTLSMHNTQDDVFAIRILPSGAIFLETQE